MGACGSKPKGPETVKGAVKGQTGTTLATPPVFSDQQNPAVATKPPTNDPKLAHIANNPPPGKDGHNIDELLNKNKPNPYNAPPVEPYRPPVITGPSEEELKLKKKREEALRYMQENRKEEPKSQIYRDDPIIVTEKIAVAVNK